MMPAYVNFLKDRLIIVVFSQLGVQTLVQIVYDVHASRLVVRQLAKNAKPKREDLFRLGVNDFILVLHDYTIKSLFVELDLSLHCGCKSVFNYEGAREDHDIFVSLDRFVKPAIKTAEDRFIADAFLLGQKHKTDKCRPSNILFH